MRIYKIISAVPMEHYKNQKGFDVVKETVIKDNETAQIKVWLSEAQYNLEMFIQENNILDNLGKKNAEKFITLLEDFGQEKYYEGSSDEAMSNSESI